MRVLVGPGESPIIWVNGLKGTCCATGRGIGFRNKAEFVCITFAEYTCGNLTSDAKLETTERDNIVDNRKHYIVSYN